MFGVFFIAFGLGLLSFNVKARIEEGFSIGIVIGATISVSIILLGIRLFRNGFPRPAKQEDSK
jgi:hypothetical protein